MGSTRGQRLVAIAAAFQLVVGLAIVADAPRPGGLVVADDPPSEDDSDRPTAPSSSSSTTPSAGPSVSPTDGVSPTGSPTTAPTGGTTGTTTGTTGTTTGTAGTTTTTTTGSTSTGSTGSTGGTSGSTSGSGGSGSSGSGSSGSTGDDHDWPSSGLFSPSEDRVGITDTSIDICMHAAFVLGGVFDNRPEDEDVYWRYLNEEEGGVYGREVSVSFTDDAYTAQGASQAAAQCHSRDPFIMMGGIGFDQTPAVREYAEEQHIPYFHAPAVRQGADGYDYSYTPAPSIEDLGRRVAELALRDHGNDRIGIVWVNSPNWKAGRDAFLARLAQDGKEVTYDGSIGSNNEAFLTHIIQMRDRVDVLYLHVNALAMARFFVEADEQGFHPTVLGEDGFNLVTDTAGEVMRNFPPAKMVWVTPAYDPSDRSTPYYDEIQRMHAAYARFRPNKVPNDVDWMFWLAFQGVHGMLLDCGPDCTRNTLTGMILSGYKGQLEPMCAFDFSGPGKGHFGGREVNLFTSVPKGNTMVWKQTATCVRNF